MRRLSHRRAFLESTGLAGAAALLSGAATETARGYLANDTLEVGCIGTGGRCRTLMQSLVKIPNVRITGVCDVWDAALAEGKKLADPQAFETKRLEELLARDDVDAVLIGTPDHWHVPATIAACQAGKDVYVEKPLTHDPAEGAAVIRAQNDHRKVVQVGTQQRSMPHIQKAYERLKAGAIGPVLKVHLTWNRPGGGRITRNVPDVAESSVDWKAFVGNAPDQAFDPYKMRNWRWFWDFGGGLLTDLMVHWIDVAHWLLETDGPERAVTAADHFAAEGAWETPDTIQTILQYPGNIQAHFEGTFSNGRFGAMIAFMGTNGTLYIDRGRYEIYPEPNAAEPSESMILGTDPRRGRDFYDLPDGELLHLTNWVECVRSREKPNAPAEAGVMGALAAQLGNHAYRHGGAANRSDLGVA